jgi:hypothetical protein
MFRVSHYIFHIVFFLCVSIWNNEPTPPPFSWDLNGLSFRFRFRRRCPILQPYVECTIEAVKDRTTLLVQPLDKSKKNFKLSAEEWPEWKRKGGEHSGSGAPEPRRLLPARNNNNQKKGGGGQSNPTTTKETLDHLDELCPLNEAEVLHYIEEQFRADNLYTRTGSILLALNPFKWMLRAYDSEAVVTKYHAGVSDDDAGCCL